MSALLLRYGQNAGDILKMRVTTGERVVTLASNGDEQVQEVERILDIQQVVAVLEEDRMVLENSIRAVTLRQGDQRWEVDLPASPPEVEMWRNGADRNVEPGAVPGLFVFPSEPVSLGDSWEAVSLLQLKHRDQTSVKLRCTVSEIAENGNVTVEICHLGDLPAIVSGRVEFSTAHGCMLLGVMENLQSDDRQKWAQWTRIELLDRLDRKSVV